MTLAPSDDPRATGCAADVPQPDIERAADTLARGELVAFPTETVYGLGANAEDDAAVARIFAAKGRPSDHPLIVHVASAEAAARFCAGQAPGVAAERLMAAFWPGPLTLIVPRDPVRAAAAAAGQRSIGLRMPSHPVALALLRAAASRGVLGVAAPSANRFGRVSPTTAAHVRAEFGPGLIVLDGGPCEVGIESAIVDLSSGAPTLLRPGQIARARIEQVLGQPLAEPGAHSPRASGTLESHYAPAARVHVLASAALCERVQAPPTPELAHAVGVYSRLAPAAGWLHRPMPEDADAAAQELYAALRWFDQRDVATLWVEQLPSDARWEGVRDRLTRAAAAAAASPDAPPP
jgi:L-threonylcarbamoyladenylate synthase